MAVACREEQDGQDRSEAPAPTADTGPGGCVPELEIVADGIDQACDGWADELGFGEPAVASAERILLGEPGFGYGWALDADLDREGWPWLAIGGNGAVGAYRTPLTSQWSVLVQSYNLGYGTVGETVAIVDWDQVLAVGDTLDDGLEVFGESDQVQIFDQDYYAAFGPFATTGLADGDLDGDGRDELVLDTPGSLWVLEAPTGPGRDGFGAPRLVVESAPPEYIGHYNGPVADLTGDGQPELTAAAGTAQGGGVWTFPGDLTGTVTTEVGWLLSGDDPDYGAHVIRVGDVDGDGYLDLLTGSVLASERAGRSYLVHGPILADGSLADADATFEGTFPSDWCGQALETLPDQDGDGTEEVVIGCARDWFLGPALPGRVEIYAGAAASGSLDASVADRVLVGREPDDLFGAALTADGDVTGDGEIDLVVGAPGDPRGGWRYYAGYAGAVYVLPLPLL